MLFSSAGGGGGGGGNVVANRFTLSVFVCIKLCDSETRRW